MNKNISIVIAIIIVIVLGIIGYSKFMNKPAGTANTQQTPAEKNSPNGQAESDGHTDHTDAEEPKKEPASDGHTDDGHN